MNTEKSCFLPIKGKPLSPFISKLKALLNDEKFHRAIKWSENGIAVVIADGETFKKIVLDRSEGMFKTTNFASFVRQLNLYGFRKVPVNGKGDPSKNMKFGHTNFRREKPELMHLVRRPMNPRKKKKPEKRPLQYDEVEYRTTRKHCRRCVMEDEGSGTEGDVESEGNSASESSSARSTPVKEAMTEFSHSNDSAFQVAKPGGTEQAALEEFMYQNLQDERMVVQLLLSLRHRIPDLTSAVKCEGFEPSPVSGPSPVTCYEAGCPMPSYCYPTVGPPQNLFGHYNPIYNPL